MTDHTLSAAPHSSTAPAGPAPPALVVTPPVVTPPVGWPPSAVGMADELVALTLAELPALGALADHDRLPAAAWLASLRSARTRRSYAGDLLGWQAWPADRSLGLLGAGRVQVDLWVHAPQHTDAGDASVRRRLSGIGSFYRYCLSHHLAAADPTAGVTRPRVDPDYTATVGLTREQGQALITAADTDTSRARLRSAAVIRLLLHNALRVEETLGVATQAAGRVRGVRGRAQAGPSSRATVGVHTQVVSALLMAR